MNIKVREQAGITILDIEGKVDINSAELIETVGWLLKQNRMKLLCNFAQVESVDYSGLSVLAVAYKNVSNHKGMMKFVNVSKSTVDLFHVVQLDRVFDIYEDEGSAIVSFRGRSSTVDKKLLRRRFKRLDIHVVVEYSLAVSRKTKSYKQRVLNMSGEGLFVHGRHTLPVGSKLKMKLKLSPESDAIDAGGLVSWLADKELQPHAYPGMGIQFTDIGKEAQEDIISFIEKNVTHRSGTNL
ncbi:MAG: anti-sigma factor antagonist [Candidatus Omnitrophica bacterium]|nr:anti-sigma factor antagonist [Candidatus Omnitrophota bacterium]